MSACLAVLNAGSSSLKFAVYDAAPGEPLLFKGQVDGIGVSPRLVLKDARGEPLEERSWPAEGFDHAAATHEVLNLSIQRIDGRPVLGVGHRVVHGGRTYARPVRIDASVIAALRELEPLAPLHQPHNLAPIQAIAEGAPHIAQVACFDTAFHRGQPPLAQMFALPRRFHEAGVQRYGFHGLSYEFVSARLRELAPDLARPGDRRPPGQRGQPVRDPGRAQRGQHHGLHRRRRPDDGHAVGRPRSRGADPPDGRPRHGRPRRWKT
jgi:acetate kinase